jgi:hypothetical protein
MTQASEKPQPQRKFRVGQVVRHRVAGGFYMRIIRYGGLAAGFPKWYCIEQGKLTSYFEWQLRKLTAREAGR